MPFDLILSQPLLALAWVLAIVLALSVHEAAHAATATALGDGTARDAGRLTLDPRAHVDPIGFLMLLFVGFGWGRPVPVDPLRLRWQRWGGAIVAFAGPAANLVGLTLAGLLLGIIERRALLPSSNLLALFLGFSFQVHIVLLLFNMIPIPPLDGSAFLLGALDRPRFDAVRVALERYGPLLLLGVVIADMVAGGHVFGPIFSAAVHWAGRLF